MTLENGDEDVGEVVLPENVMKASPAQLREIGNQTYNQINIKPVNHHSQLIRSLDFEGQT